MNKHFMLHVTGFVAIPSPVSCGQVISLLEAESLENNAAAVPGAPPEPAGGGLGR